MTLEDFFTLTEMKDGLTAASRVHELVAVMKKEKFTAVKNIGDATRQWAAVASTVAATENKDCLDLFINLDGLLFFDRWLKLAQKFSNETGEGSVEESITALLRALEKLQIDKERSITSGVWDTVNNLLDHNSSRVQDRARALFNSWKPGEVSDAIHHDVQSVGAFDNVGMKESNTGKTECVVHDVPLSNRRADVENNAAEQTGDESLQSRSSNSLPSESTQDVQIQTNDCDHQNLDHRNLENRTEDPLTASVDRSLDPRSPPVVSTSDQESPPFKEKSQVSSTVEGAASTETHSLAVPKGHTAEPDPEAPKMLTDKSAASSNVEAAVIYLSNVAGNAQEIVTGSALQNNIDTKEDNCRANASGDVAAPLSTSKVGTDEVENRNQCQTPMFNSTAKDGEFSPDHSQHSSGNNSVLEKLDNLGGLFSRMEDVASDDDREHGSDGAEDNSDFSKPNTDKHSPDLIDRRRSNIELEYGIVDALEVARQVAQEVEREVVDFREQSCSSSSEKIMESGIKQPGSPDSINAKQDLSTEIPPENVPTRQNQPFETHAEQEERMIDSNNLENEAENGMHDLESSQVTEVAQEPEVNAEKGLCDFDLNEEVCSEDMDRPVNTISAPISVVSASRPAAASGSPVAPLRFEGTHGCGWRGSAATSAFRPASPRKTSDGDKTLETGVSSNSSKRRQVCLDIDLNVAGGGEEKVMDLILSRQMPVSSGFHSGESYLEVGSRRPERPNLDLNRTSDDGDATPTDLRLEGRLFYQWNGHRSPSPALSSSSRQPSMRNFDLNDSPFFQNDSLDQGLYHSKTSQTASTYGGPKPGDPVISIMGTRVEVGSRMEVDRKSFIPQTTSMPNGKPLEHAMDANLTRMGAVLGIVPSVSYTHSPVFGFNALATAPAMPISSAMYGPTGSIPYMVDSRGAPVMPQIMGSTPTVPPYSQQPFIMSMSGAPLGLNGAGPSRPSFDLNSGFTMEGGSIGGSRQLLMPGQGSSRPSSSSGVGGKRKEPDSGRLLESAIRSSNAQYDDPDILDRLRVKMLPQGTGDRGWDVFSLEYDARVPLDTVFTESVMARYLRIFNFLWKLRRVEHALIGAWKTMKPNCITSHSFTKLQHAVKLQLLSTLRQCQVLWNQMNHFVTNLQYYIMFEVLEVSWSNFSNEMEGAKDLDDLLAAHDKYLHSIVEKSLLGERSQSLYKSLFALFDLILRFRSHADRLCEGIYELQARTRASSLSSQDKTKSQRQTRDNLSEPGSWFSDGRKALEQRAGEFLQNMGQELEEISKEYTVLLEGFLSQLPVQQHVDLKFLFFRLDFTEFYSRLRPGT